VTDKKLYREALDQVRQDYRSEIEATARSYIAIRDNPKAEHKDIINANKGLLLILGVARPAEVRVTNPDTKPHQNPADWDLSPEERERVESIIREN
jgi:hypothetical protein